MFGLMGNAVNIAVNTQGVERLYGRSVMAAFHGMWSLAGVGAVMLGRGVEPAGHFLGTFVCGVGAEKGWVGAGYTPFMAAMASGHFLADGRVRRLGLKRVFQLSGVLMGMGLGLAVARPALPTAMAGFLLVGFGVSAVVPLVYGVAGRSRTMPAGVALAAVSTIGFLGFLLGPPRIGLVAGLSSLRVSFALVACWGLGVAVLASTREL